MAANSKYTEEFKIKVAEATLMLLALWVPTVIISLYNSSTKSEINGVEPEVIFLIFEIVCSLSPGFIRSGL